MAAGKTRSGRKKAMNLVVNERLEAYILLALELDVAGKL
jgi:hypothetical protein